MADNEQALQRILEKYYSGVEGSGKAKSIAKKLSDGSTTYAEAYEAAREHGRILSDVYNDQLPELLEEGRLPIETAEAVVKPSMVRSTKEVSKVARQIQEQMNADAGIGIGFIEPDPNIDQIEGIISGLCDSKSYAAGEKLFRSRVENYLEGHVDDCVHDNAQFQYDAGLSPKIERRAVANCCKWCSALAGVYEYEKVSGTGNDVFRRHRNCHCQVLYSPDGSKRRQNVHSKKWTEEGKADRIAFAKVPMKLDLQKHAHKTGDYRRMEHGAEWQELSLKDTVAKFAKGAKPVPSDDKTKMSYISKNGKYEVKYDRKGDYFRILDRDPESKRRPYVDKDGNPVMNITENGKTRSATNDEYERLTHFKNSDKRGKK